MKSRAELIRAATADGWTVSRTGGDHLKLTHPSASTPVYTGSTPSDHRAVRNTLAMMKRVLPPEDKQPKPERPKRHPKPPSKPARQEIETAIDWQAPAQPTPRPRRPLPGAPRLAMSRWS